MSIRTSTLSSGLRIITDYVPGIETVAVGVWADVGTRHEKLEHNGVAHMVEHMMFNGTPTRTSLQIAEAIEDVGGQVNAYTSREITAYYIHLLKMICPWLWIFYPIYYSTQHFRILNWKKSAELYCRKLV